MTEVRNNKPKKEFLLMIIIMLRKSQRETGMSLVEFLESFEDDDIEVDTYDDKTLRKAIRKYLISLYPPELETKYDLGSLQEDDKTAEEIIDEGPTPQVYRLPDEEQDAEPEKTTNE